MSAAKPKKEAVPAATLHAVENQVLITAPNMQVVTFACEGTAPLMISRFSMRDVELIKAQQQAGSQSRSKKTREAKDFEGRFRAACYQSDEGWYGINASAFRLGMISACRLVGFKMTLAKLSVFVEQDGFDKDDGTPLVRIHGGDPHMDIRPVRNSSGVMDLRSRPMWKRWSARPRIRYDLAQFSLTDVTNLLARVGLQIGIGEGRPDSRMSAGLGFGTFSVAEQA